MHKSEDRQQLMLTAARCLREGRIDDGIVAYQDLLAVAPELTDAWYNLAYLQRCARQFSQAIQSYNEALSRGIARPEEIYLNISVILSEHLNRTAEAEEKLLEAVRMNPRFLPAWLNLGSLYEDLGDAVKARSAYASALGIAPQNGRAHGRLAMIDIFESKTKDAVSKLRRALEDSPTELDDTAELGFALGHALDDLGEFDKAFEAFEAANIARRSELPGTGYDAAAQERLVDRLIDTFPLDGATSAGEKARSPIFICGMFRSGSTLAEQIMARHSRVTAGGELEFLPAIIVEKLQPFPEALALPTAPTANALRKLYLDGLHKIHGEYDFITDKRPDNFLYVGLIKHIFPDAKIVHSSRNAIDNILSIFFTNFDSSISYGSDLSDISHWFRQYRKLMGHWKSMYNDDIFDLDYDSLIVEPDTWIRKLMQFCDIPWEDQCLTPQHADGPIRTPSAWQVRQPLHDRSSGRSRNYAAQAREIQALLDS